LYNITLDLTDIDLSLEFLMGRTLDNAMLNIGMKNVAAGLLKPPCFVVVDY